MSGSRASRPDPRPIFFVIPDLDIGGTEHHLVRILPGLKAAGLNPSVYTITHRGALAPRLEAQGIPVIAPPLAVLARRLPRRLRRLAILPVSAPFLLSVLLCGRPGAAHFFLPAAYLIGGLLSLAAPVRVRVISRRSLNEYQLRHPVLARVERLLHPRMSAVLGNSRAVIAQLRDEGVPERRLGLIPNGIDGRPFAELPPRHTLRADLGLPDTALIIAKVANLIPYKGHADLLHALAGITGKLPAGWVVLLVGSGREEAALRRLVAALDLESHVRFLGRRDDVHRVLGAADIGVLCSHEEGFPNSVLEGMAAGLPMVVTDVGGNPEAVVDGETGIVVGARDPDALAGAIRTLADDPGKRRSMGEAGRRRVEAHFSLDACVARYRALYVGLMEGRAGTVSALIASAGDEAGQAARCAGS